MNLKIQVFIPAGKQKFLSSHADCNHSSVRISQEKIPF